MIVNPNVDGCTKTRNNWKTLSKLSKNEKNQQSAEN